MSEETEMVRMFTDEQLREIAEPLCDKALRALNDGDLVTLNGLLNEMTNGPAGLNALGIPILARFFSEFRRDFGEERAGDLLERIGRNLLRTMIDDYRAGKRWPLCFVTEVANNGNGADTRAALMDRAHRGAV